MDARKQPRAQVALKPEYLGPADFDYVGTRTVDISTGGMFLESDRPIASGTLIKIRCEPQEAEGTIEGVAKVVWIRTQPVPAGPPGMGVKFVKLKGDSERVLKALVDGVVAAGGAVAPAPTAEPAERAAEAEPPAEAEPAAAAERPATPAQAFAENPAQTDPPRGRPSAADLAARLRESKAPPAQDVAAVAPAPSGAAPSSDARAPAADPGRTTEPVELPHSIRPIALTLGLAVVIAAVGLWLLLR